MLPVVPRLLHFPPSWEESKFINTCHIQGQDWLGGDREAPPTTDSLFICVMKSLFPPDALRSERNNATSRFAKRRLTQSDRRGRLSPPSVEVEGTRLVPLQMSSESPPGHRLPLYLRIDIGPINHQTNTRSVGLTLQCVAQRQNEESQVSPSRSGICVQDGVHNPPVRSFSV